MMIKTSQPDFFNVECSSLYCPTGSQVAAAIFAVQNGTADADDQLIFDLVMSGI